MSLTVNTNIVNDTDQYLLDAKNVKGGYIVVETINKRDTLPTATIMNGSLCYCQEDSKFYQYDGTNWIEAALGGKVDKLIIGDGEANGLHSIAGGSTNSSIIDNYVGTGIASSAINLLASDAKGNMSIALGAGIQDVKVLGVTLMPGQKNIAYSDASIAIGLGNISGGKGYYVSAINTTDRTLTLSTTQKTATAPTTAPSWKAGDRLFFENDDRYFLEVAANTTNSTVKVKELPFNSLASFSTYTKPTERAIINVTRPESGEVTLGFGAIGIGAQNISVGSGAYAVGYKNVVAGAYGAAFGQENQVGYSAFSTGIKNKSLGKATFTSGEDNEASADFATALGKNTKARTKYSTTIGRNTETRDGADAAFAGGNGSVANHYGSFLHGNWLTSSRHYQAVFGEYNKYNENENALLIVGNGEDNSNRSNAFEVLKNGSVVAGRNCKSESSCTFAGGNSSSARHYGAFLHGNWLTSSRHYQAVFGEHNKENSKALLIVGAHNNVHDTSVVRNAFEVLDNGEVRAGTAMLMTRHQFATGHNNKGVVTLNPFYLITPTCSYIYVLLLMPNVVDSNSSVVEGPVMSVVELSVTVGRLSCSGVISNCPLTYRDDPSLVRIEDIQVNFTRSSTSSNSYNLELFNNNTNAKLSYPNYVTAIVLNRR